MSQDDSSKLAPRKYTWSAGTWMWIVVIVASATLMTDTLARTTGVGQPSMEELIASKVVSPPEIIYTNSSDNCGAVDLVGGCYRSETPSSIYISPDLPYVQRKYVVLHELAHFVQWRDGESMDECLADSIAEQWGADLMYSGYTEECKA